MALKKNRVVTVKLSDEELNEVYEATRNLISVLIKIAYSKTGDAAAAKSLLDRLVLRMFAFIVQVVELKYDEVLKRLAELEDEEE